MCVFLSFSLSTHILTFHAASSFKIIVAAVLLYINWEIITPYVAPGLANPFAPLIFISHPLESSSSDDPRYAKGYLDLVFVASYLVVFSFLRQVFILHIFRRFARWYGIKKSKFDRFGEQGYAIVYWGSMSVWGYVSFFSTCKSAAVLTAAAHYGASTDLLVQHQGVLDRRVSSVGRGDLL